MRRRILGSIIVITGLAILLFGVPLGIAVDQRYRDEEILRLEREAAEAIRLVPSTVVATGDPLEVRADEKNVALALYDLRGQRVDGRGPAHADRAVRAALRGDVQTRTGGSKLVAAVPVSRDEQVVGALRAATPESVVSDRVWTAWVVMAALGVLVLGVSALVALWQTRRITRPVEQLAASAEALGDGDFTRRAAEPGIPEIDAVALALNRTAERLGEQLARERAFSADASHQLRTPLTGLRLLLESAVLTSEARPDADVSGTLAAALAQVDRLDATIDDLLALARDTHVTGERLAVAALLDDVDAAWRAPLAAAGRPLRISVAPSLPEVAVSGSAARQILQVLLDNASRHGEGEVDVAGRGAADGVVVEVTDQGTGIAGDPGTIFRRRTRDRPGHSIGLALARTLAEAEGARLVLARAAPHPVFALFLPGADGAGESRLGEPAKG